MVETNLMQQPPFFHQVLELGGEFIVRGLDKSQFDKLALDNPELRMERAQNGEIEIRPPVKGGSGFRENRLSTDCLLYTSPSPRDATLSRMPSSA